MLNGPQIERMLNKVRRFESNIEPFIFEKVGELDDVSFCHVDKQYHSIPDLYFEKAEKGMKWSGESTYCWFKGSFKVPEELGGKTLFVRPHIGGYEAMLFVNGKPFGTFATKIVCTGHGNHYCDMIRYAPEAGENIDVAFEYYSGHYIPGCDPNSEVALKDFVFDYNGADICIKNYDVQDFYFDLKTLNQLTVALPQESFRRAEVVNCLYEVYKIVCLSTEDTPFDEILASMKKAAPLMKECLSKKNGDSAPEAAIIGHSHMDTAWLWHVEETIKKCARTYSNQLNLMEQYPEYKFIQSSACHSNMLLKHYPELFERIQKAVAEGKYEPNGGVWVECDCNITSGESMIRQFLWGQRFTRKYFNFTSNCFWLPDTFGYSAAIPQIMKGCGVDYFLTTKISWNDTNKFPYDTFYWQGIDGTKVFTHFNTTHHDPDPSDIISNVIGHGAGEGIKQKTVNNKRYLSYGYGDGGGGPQFEMIEMARRCKDLEGVPKTDYQFVGDFMKELEATCVEPNTYRGELYLELHRGTLTNQHTIKRNNRKSELRLRDLEIMTVNDAVKNNNVADGKDIAPLYETLLLNQFHDILPGTAINRTHVESRAQTNALIKKAGELTDALISTDGDAGKITVINTLSFDRTDVIALDYIEGKIVAGDYKQQIYTDIDGKKKLLVAGVTVPAMSSVTLTLADGVPNGKSAFASFADKLSTPFAEVSFADNKTIASFIDKRADRELVNGKNFNTFLMAEDMPASWDNWDIDADLEAKFVPASDLISSEVISDGEVAYIIRNVYKISSKSTVTQDMIFYADSAEVRFDTAMDWNDDHRFLKTAFDTSVYDDFARHEIQFGYAKRPTTRNTSLEQAKFEVLNHKYSDISETRFGVAVLNDCKYGITAKDGSLRLSLHKGGNHPDHMGDKDGIHRCVYSFLPHDCAFGAASVIKPAYMLNIPVLSAVGAADFAPLVNVGADNVIVESIKPCEDAEKAYIVRIYEAEGSYTKTELSFAANAKEVCLVNMLEENPVKAGELPVIFAEFRPFEIKTYKVTY